MILRFDQNFKMKTLFFKQNDNAISYDEHKKYFSRIIVMKHV